jgi:hypothetical protein
MLSVPPPPVARWVRLSEAAARVGIPPRLLASDIEAGNAHVRTQTFGRRGLVFVASEDVEALRHRLEQGGAR